MLFRFMQCFQTGSRGKYVQHREATGGSSAALCGAKLRGELTAPGHCLRLRSHVEWRLFPFKNDSVVQLIPQVECHICRALMVTRDSNCGLKLPRSWERECCEVGSLREEISTPKFGPRLPSSAATFRVCLCALTPSVVRELTSSPLSLDLLLA